MFYLLSFIYHPATIDLIKTNVIGENTIFALEIIENFISQDIKQIIIPLLDKISVSQRIKKLRSYFPQKKLKFNDRLRDIIVRDYNKVDLWTIAKAIELLGKIHRKSSSEVKVANESQDNVDVWTREKVNELLTHNKKSEMPDEIFVCLYHHPDELVYSTAAKILYDENPARTIDSIERLDESKREIIKVLTEPEETKNLLIERVKLIKRVHMFFSVPENVLVKLVKKLRAKKIRRNNVLKMVNDDGTENVFIILRGIVYYERNGEEITFSKNSILARGSSFTKDVNELIVKKDTLVLQGNKFEYYNLLVDEVDIVRLLLEMKK